MWDERDREGRRQLKRSADRGGDSLLLLCFQSDFDIDDCNLGRRRKGK